MNLFRHLIFLLFLRVVEPKKVVIFDTTRESALRWHTNSQSSEEGWIEESVTDIRDGVNARSYVTCEVEKENVDNWVRTPFIDKGAARRLSIELKFTIRDCKLYPRQTRTCKETFSLYMLETDLDIASKNAPAWSDQIYHRIDRVTADAGRFSDRGNVPINVEVRSVPVTKKGLYFAFRDEGACVSLLGVKIFYEVCEETVTNFAWFPETPSGPDPASIQSTVGHCVDNASPPSGVEPKFVCKADGAWDLLSGGCQCNRGYRADGQRCVACEIGTYKESPGFGDCNRCPARSSAQGKAAGQCVCDAGFYRAVHDAKSAACTRPPSRPENSELVSVDQTSAIIKWNQPVDLGGRQDLWYRVECQECPPGAQFYPAKSRFNATRLTVTNLEPSVVYTVFVYAENQVSSQVDGLPMYSVVEVQTKASTPWHVANFKVDSVSENQTSAPLPANNFHALHVQHQQKWDFFLQVALSWDAPRLPMDYEPMVARKPGSAPNAQISGLETQLERRRQKFVQYYQVRFHQEQNKMLTFNRTVSYEPRVTLNNLLENMDYYFEVRPYTSKGWGAWSEPKHAKTLGGSYTSNGSSDSNVTAWTAVVLAAIVFSVVVFWSYRRCPKNSWIFTIFGRNKQTSDLDTLEYKTDQTTVTPDYNSGGHLRRKLTSAFNTPHYKPYVDPTTYEDPNQILSEIANEIDASCVIIEEIIGAGEFGEVCKGKLRWPAGHTVETTVAIKTLKPGSGDKAKSDFLTEASIMGQFDHPNVIQLRGVVTKAEPVMIITEYVENRSLDSFLRANDGKLETLQLVKMLCSVAQGMKYLNDKGFIHRDLAARNVLLDKNLACKIADFGLSRGVGGSTEQVYTTKGGKIPVRWTAPEAITFRKFTSSSDVWSYGVLMWEVMSYGERPYWDWTNQQVIQAVEEGYRLPPPMDCPLALHRLMLECWNKERQYRPTFSAIVLTLQNFCQCPELLYSPAMACAEHSTTGCSFFSLQGAQCDANRNFTPPDNPAYGSASRPVYPAHRSIPPVPLANYGGVYGSLRRPPCATLAAHHPKCAAAASAHGAITTNLIDAHAAPSHGMLNRGAGALAPSHGSFDNSPTIDDLLRHFNDDRRLRTLTTHLGLQGHHSINCLFTSRLTAHELIQSGYLDRQDHVELLDRVNAWKRQFLSSNDRSSPYNVLLMQNFDQATFSTQAVTPPYTVPPLRSQPTPPPPASGFHYKPAQQQQHNNDGFFV